MSDYSRKLNRISANIKIRIGFEEQRKLYHQSWVVSVAVLSGETIVAGQYPSSEIKIWNFNEDSGFDQTKEHVSIIAQEIQDFMPEMISTYKGELNGKETEVLRVDASDMTWLLVKAIQEQQCEIKQLKLCLGIN